MGQNSQAGQVGFGIQTIQGTAVAATRFARLRGGSLGGDRSLLIPDAEIGGNRDIPSAYLGPVGFSGDLEFYPRMEMLALLMKGVLGSSASSSVAGTAEIQNVATTGVPTGGTFTLTFRGQTTTPLPYNSAAAAVQTALLALGGGVVGAGDVTATGGPLPAAVVLTWGGQYANRNVPAVTAVSALTGGTNPAVVVTTPTAGVNPIGTHIITPADTVPWLSVEERIGVNFESYRYTDAKVNSLHIEAEAAGYLMGTASMVALTQASGFTAQAAPAWDTSPMMVGGQVQVRFNGASLVAKSFSMDINNNIETDNFVLGSIFLADATEKRRELKVAVTRRPNDSTLWKAAMYGSSTATTPQAGPAYQGAVQIVASSFETIGDVVAGTPFSITIDIPNCVIAPHKIGPSGDDVISSDIELTPIRPDSAVPIATVTIRNDLATIT